MVVISDGWCVGLGNLQDMGSRYREKSQIEPHIDLAEVTRDLSPEEGTFAMTGKNLELFWPTCLPPRNIPCRQGLEQGS
jgi:hypothetical protein